MKTKTVTKAQPRASKSPSGQAGKATKRLVGWVLQAKQFLLEVWAELHKVQWPSWNEARSFTVVVLTAVMAVAAYIGILDWIFTRVFQFLYR